MIAPASTAQPSTKVTEPIANPSSAPIEQAIAVRNTLRQLLNDTNALITSLKRQQQQSRLVQSTLQSLRQLQGVS